MYLRENRVAESRLSWYTGSRGVDWGLRMSVVLYFVYFIEKTQADNVESVFCCIGRRLWGGKNHEHVDWWIVTTISNRLIFILFYIFVCRSPVVHGILPSTREATLTPRWSSTTSRGRFRGLESVRRFWKRGSMKPSGGIAAWSWKLQRPWRSGCVVIFPRAFYFIDIYVFVRCNRNPVIE